jgi:hypothetical protein
LPYTLWFKIVMFGVFPIACLLGITSGTRRPPLLAEPDAKVSGEANRQVTINADLDSDPASGQSVG